MAVVRFWKCFATAAAAALVLSVVAPAQAQENEPGHESPIESAHAVLSDGTYQSELPTPPEPRERPEPSTASEPQREASVPSSDPAPAAKTRRRAEPDSETSDTSASDGTWLWVAAAVVGVPLIAYIFLTWYRARPAANAAKLSNRRKRKIDRPVPTPPPASTAINEPTILDEADRFADAGRYGEAIHFLLLNGLEHAGRRARQRIPPALTNRELLRALPLAENMARALSVLVRLSERSHFGDAAPSAADYQLSRENFQLFALESGAAS